MTTPPPFSPVPSARPNQRLAITSLVLGLLSLLCLLLIFTGLPAIITGHLAFQRARRQPQEFGGAGLALAGLMLGYLSVLLTLLLAVAAAFAIPAWQRSQHGSMGTGCERNLKQLSLASRMWAIDHRETLPPDFRSMSNELAVPNLLLCPDDRSKRKAPEFHLLDPAQHVTYEFLKPGAKEADVTGEIIFRCPIHGNLTRGDGSYESGPRAP